MPDWRRLVRKRVGPLGLHPIREDEIVEELAQHLEDRYQECIAGGATTGEATRAALADLSHRQQLIRKLRWLERPVSSEPIISGAPGGKIMILNLWQDLRYAIRTLRKSPGYTAVAVITLALGIGANTAMFGLLNTFLFRALPYQEPDRLLRLYRTSPHSQSWPHSQGNFFDYRDQNDVFEYMTAVGWIAPSLTEPGEPPERVRGMTTTSDFFPSLGVQPVLGRFPTEQEYDQDPSGSRVVVLSNRFWKSHFAGDPNVVGSTMRLNGLNSTVIGVMPSSFENPLLFGSIDLWTPLLFTSQQKHARNSNWLQAFARLKPGVTSAQAQSAMAQLASNFSDQNLMVKGESLRLEPLQKSLADDIQRPVMWFTFGLAGFVLLIACGNLANLQLVRTAARAREFAIRSALGARRTRLIRQSLAESLVVSVVGGILSLALAVWSARFMSQKLFSNVPGAKLDLDFVVFGFAMVCSVMTGLLFGTVPAWLSSRVDVNQTLRESARGSIGARSHNRLRHFLIVGEVAFALVLLAGAGLFLRGLVRFMRLDPGWQVGGLVTAQLQLQGSKYNNDEKNRNFLEQLRQRLSEMPGVSQVALSKSEPVWGFQSSGSFIVEGQPEPDPSNLPEIFREPVSPGYFETLGARLREGRTFTISDAADRPKVCVVNESMARAFFPNESAVGKRIGSQDGDHNWTEIVGVIEDIRFPATLDKPYTRYQSFAPMAQLTWGGGWTILMRASSKPGALATDLRAVVAGMDGEMPVYEIRSADELVKRGLGDVSLLGTLLGSFAALGLSLAAIGIYGVTSYSVVQRTGEIGIRMALGARPKDVLWLVLGNGARLSLFGAGIGAAGGYAVTRLLESAIPTLPSRDPIAFAVISAGLVAVALFSCWLPARRASRVDPIEALRCE